jgi:tRNA(fMet)-specific endonuclease VapC
LRGWPSYIARAKSSKQNVNGYAKLHALLEDFATRPVLDFDPQAAAEFERLIGSRLRIGTMDLRIAAIALAHDALLLSKNLIDFPEFRGCASRTGRFNQCTATLSLLSAGRIVSGR